MTAAALPSRRTLTSNERWRRRGGMVQDALLVVITGMFVWVYANKVIDSRSITSLFFAVEQSILIAMFLTRRRSHTTSARPADWVAATLGGWLPLALRPVDGVGDSAAITGTALQLAGLTLTSIGFLALGKSFGVVAANRGLKVKGPYSIVRHPIYFSHTITMTGFLVANFSPVNLALLLTISAFQVVRMNAEERILIATSDYASYKSRVPYRLIPRVY